MSCCCPPAISALFCLWARSGFSKSSVAGALTFFPPDPPLYKFTKVYHPAAPKDDNNGDDDADDDDHDGEEKDCEKDKMIQHHHNDDTIDENVGEDSKQDQQQETNVLAQDDDEKNVPDCMATTTGKTTTTTSTTATINTTTTTITTTTTTTNVPSSHTRRPQDANPSSSPTRPPSNTTNTDTNNPPTQMPIDMEPNVHPATALMQRSLKLRQEAKYKNRQDFLDASMGVTYTFHPDPRLVPPPGYSGTMEAVKIPHLQQQQKQQQQQEQQGTSSSCTRKISWCGKASQDGSDINHVACVIYRIREDRVTARTKTIIYSHGNATDIGAMHFMQVVIAKGLRCNVVMYDYSGYGESGGVALEENTYKDIEAVYQYVLDHVVENRNERNIILYGQSVGGGPSCYLAAKKKDVGGLILHSAFLSGMRVLTPSRALACLDIFPNIIRIQKVQCPVMVIHGMLDEEVGFEHGVALHDAVPDHCKRNPWWVMDRGHNDITDGRQKILQYIQKLKTFLDSLVEDD